MIKAYYIIQNYVCNDSASLLARDGHGMASGQFSEGDLHINGPNQQAYPILTITFSFLFILLVQILFISVAVAQPKPEEISKVWLADKGDGTYQNPILHADYSDPDVCRVGDDFYMTSSSFNAVDQPKIKSVVPSI